MIENVINNIILPSEGEVVEFNDQSHPRIKINPIYFELGFSPLPHIFGRRGVLDRILKALDYLPSQYGFLIWDVYRPRSVQGKLFNWMQEEIRKKFPQLNDQENLTETKKYASLPSKIGDIYCPPHLSGGAIDLTLYEISNGNELEMGTLFDDCTDRAHTNYFSKKLLLTPREKMFKENRNLLLHVMKQVGFVSYEYEWWHFDIGNMFWSRITHKPAVFGPLFGDKEWPK